MNINSNHSKLNGINITDNAHVNKNYSVFENSRKNKGNPSKNVKGKKKWKTTLCFNKKEPPKKKVTVIGDSMMKYLRHKYFPLSVPDENCSKPLF